MKSKNLASFQSVLFFEIKHQYLFLSINAFKLSKEAVLKHAAIDMFTKMGCGHEFGKLPWPTAWQDFSFSYK